MNCPCCGSPMPDGVTFCANCGNEANQYNSMIGNGAPASPFNVNDSLFNTPNQYSSQYNQWQYNQSPSYASKKSTGGLIAACIALIIILAIGALYVFRFSTIPIAGTYKIYSLTVDGQEMTVDEIESIMDFYSSQISSVYSSYEIETINWLLNTEIEVKAIGKGKMYYGGRTKEVRIKVNGDKITLFVNGEELDGTIDRKDKSIELDFSSISGKNILVKFDK